MGNSKPASTKFTDGSLMGHVVRMSLASSLGIMAIYVVDLCDIFFISLLGKKQMAAAAGFASTVMFFVSAVSVGVSVAAATLISTALGADDKTKARQVATSATIFSMAVAATSSVILMYYSDPILAFIGAKDDVAGMAKQYLWIVLPSSMFSAASMVAVSALRSVGEARWSMYPSLIGALVNLVLDPILIFGLDLGLPGAAWATAAARIATLAVAMYATIKMHSLYAHPLAAHPGKHIKPILGFAIPAVITSLAPPVGMATVTRFMAEFGAGAVVAMAVVGRLYPVVFSVVNALSGAAGPIIGQNYGAGKLDRVHGAYMSSIKFLAVYVVAIGALLFIIRPYIGAAFSLDGLALDLLYLFCGPLAIIAFFNGTVMVSNGLFANVGVPRYSVWMQWGRSTLGLYPFLAVCSHFWGAQGVFIGATLGGGVFALIAFIVSTRLMHRITEQAKSEQKDVVDISPPMPNPQSGWEG